MFQSRLFIGLFAVCLAATAHAQTQLYPVEGGVTLKARAYTDHSGKLEYASRYDLSIAKTPGDTKWDFTFDDRPDYHYTGGISSAFYPTTYKNKPTAILRTTLHQYEIYEERVTFKNLDLGPNYARSSSPIIIFAPAESRCLELSEPQTVVTPSGISVTLPAQGAQTLQDIFMGSFSGNANALFMKVNVSPSQREVTLPDSPLYKKYGKPVTVKLETPHPNLMVWYMADNTFKQLAVGLPNLKTLKHLDSLTLILRQRVELQSIPVAIEVPVERPAKTK